MFFAIFFAWNMLFNVQRTRSWQNPKIDICIIFWYIPTSHAHIYIRTVPTNASFRSVRTHIRNQEHCFSGFSFCIFK